MSPAGALFATFAVLMLLGSPITVALGVAAMTALYTVDQNLVTLVQIAFTSVNSFPIMALPAFMLVGALMECAGISRRLVAIAENIVGPIPGGLAVSTALACVFFGAISGSGPATTAAVGMLMIPAMIRRGFSKGYAAAAAATAGGVGIIIPPSIPMVVYAVSGQQSITKNVPRRGDARHHDRGGARRHAPLPLPEHARGGRSPKSLRGLAAQGAQGRALVAHGPRSSSSAASTGGSSRRPRPPWSPSSTPSSSGCSSTAS